MRLTFAPCIVNIIKIKTLPLTNNNVFECVCIGVLEKQNETMKGACEIIE